MPFPVCLDDFDPDFGEPVEDESDLDDFLAARVAENISRNDAVPTASHIYQDPLPVALARRMD